MGRSYVEAATMAQVVGTISDPTGGAKASEHASLKAHETSQRRSESDMGMQRSDMIRGDKRSEHRGCVEIDP